LSDIPVVVDEEDNEWSNEVEDRLVTLELDLSKMKKSNLLPIGLGAAAAIGVVFTQFALMKIAQALQGIAANQYKIMVHVGMLSEESPTQQFQDYEQHVSKRENAGPGGPIRVNPDLDNVVFDHGIDESKTIPDGTVVAEPHEGPQSEVSEAVRQAIEEDALKPYEIGREEF